MDEKLKDKISSDDKSAIEKAVDDALSWLDRNQLGEKEEFEAKQKEVEAVVNPIMMKVYQGAAGEAGAAPGAAPGGAAPGAGATGGASSGPTVEEVD